MAGKGGRKTKKKTERSPRARKSDTPVVEENVQELSDRDTSDDLPEHPSKVYYSFGFSNKLSLFGVCIGYG